MAIYHEMPGYPKEQWTFGDLRATRKLICNWTDRYTVYNSFFSPPKVYPYAASTLCIARGGSIEPFEAKIDAGLTDDIAVYEKAIVTIEYGSPGASSEGEFLSGDAIINESIAAFAEFLTLDPSLFKWANGDPLKDDEAPGRQVHGLTYTYRRVNAPLPLSGNILSFVGKVNQAAVDLVTVGAGMQFGIETLLYIRPEIERRDGNTANVVLYFQYNPNGWNKWWRVKTQAFEEMQTVEGQPYKNYPVANFVNLIL